VNRVRVEVADGIGRIILDRPEKRNALDLRFAEEMLEALAALTPDDAVRVITLSANGPDFCAGADLAAMESLIGASDQELRKDAEALAFVFTAIRSLPKPVVALVHGRALAGGCGLANACDIVIAHADAQFGYPEVRLGFIPAMVMTMLTRTVGEKVAADLVLSGRTIDADEAMRIGLVSRVLSAAAFESESAKIVQGLAKSAPTALAATKHLLYHLGALDFDAGMKEAIAANVKGRRAPGFQEGLRRFLARHKEGK
jgi:methylglutaconyl-CoA hydratase